MASEKKKLKPPVYNDPGWGDSLSVSKKALQELAHVAVTEACVSGLCDICLEQPMCRRDVFGPPWRDSNSSRRSGKQVNK